ncbi:MBL fold metallo-hydrolase RNA specificity domain-containing protein [Desulfogranum mediterraneum]|uniref:MBL fold metallo-hydrolase RNA specificity domain-containing protein n=1 Tax=Desulfogranum mediterraneum TaxID=160661 RepID=UPI00040679C2|nr:MBL fold metallo-hydrolase [Desulfogranum mediterraneum]
MELQFHGAAKNVTGSCHLLRCGQSMILIDCGLYQGSRELAEENHNDFGFDPAAIDLLLLTHGHLDHCGRIPLLVKRGFTGTIVTTAASRDLARLVMLDAARIQEEEARYRNYKSNRHDRDREPLLPLYDTFDALNSLDYFTCTVSLERPHELAAGIRATFYDAGHILGSASILLELEEQGQSKRLLFSGDLGYCDRAILPDPTPPPQADIVVMETTYGDRRHKQLEPSVSELYQAITTTVARKGNVLIPSFALERSQEILYYLREGIENGLLPPDLEVFLDSPMAISATQIFRRHPECFDDETWQVIASGRDPFELPRLHFSRETEDSIALKEMQGVVIIAGSGMCTAGRIRHHLRHNLWREEAAVIFVGYAGVGTTARQIIDGAPSITIFREEVEVRADIHTIGGFSAHADQQELLNWHRQTGSPELTFLVHGEEEAMTTFGALLTGTRVILPDNHQSFSLEPG